MTLSPTLAGRLLGLALVFVGMLLVAGAPKAEPATAVQSSFDGAQGRISYTDTGAGALVVLVPGTDAPTAEFRYVVPHLVENGFRVVTLVTTPLADSSSSSVRASALGADIVELLRQLHAGPAYLTGSAAAAGAVAWATAVAPQEVCGLVLLGPSLAETAQAPLPNMRTLVVMGESDPAFAAPKLEAEAVARLLHGSVQMVAQAGGLPHVDAPAMVGPAMIDFMDRLQS
jgi:pimeloyl-ACP methyl ester carboxylesterase